MLRREKDSVIATISLIDRFCKANNFPLYKLKKMIQANCSAYLLA
jgi:hypothetical protein